MFHFAEIGGELKAFPVEGFDIRAWLKEGGLAHFKTSGMLLYNQEQYDAIIKLTHNIISMNELRDIL